MKSSYFIPPELRKLPLNVVMCMLLDYCTEHYHDAVVNLVRDRWQADAKYYSPEAIIDEIGGKDYLAVMPNSDKEKMSRFLSTIFSIKGGRDSLQMMLALLGIHGQIIDYMTYERDGRFPGIIDPEVRPSIPVVQPCEVYVILEVGQDDVTGNGIEFELFRKVVELFLWTCSDLVAILIIRRILDSTMPVIGDYGHDTNIRQDYGDSLVFNPPYHNSGRRYNDGTVVFPDIPDMNAVSTWPPFLAPWTPVQPSSDYVDDPEYRRCWKVRPDGSRIKNVAARINHKIVKGDYATLLVPIFVPEDSNVNNIEVALTSAGVEATSRISISKGEWQMVHLYDFSKKDGTYFDISFVISTSSNSLLGEILIGKPEVYFDKRTTYELGDPNNGEIGMYDKLDLIEG